MFQCVRTSFIHYATTLYDSSEAVIWSSSVKKVFLKISQNSQENNFARVSFLIKLQAFLTEHLRWLLLSLVVLRVSLKIYFHTKQTNQNLIMKCLLYTFSFVVRQP